MGHDISYQHTDLLLPLVSVIVLTYKKFDNLIGNITSILQQDYPNIEIILQDDGSDNFPKEEIIEIVNKQQTVKQFRFYQNAKNIGTVKNYNLAISRATGEFIVPLSQDDIFVGTDAVSRIVRCFQNGEFMLCTGKRRETNTGRIYPNDQDIKLLQSTDKKKLLLRTMIMNFVSGAVLYFRKNCFYNSGEPVFDERFFLLEDWPFLLKCIDNEIRIGVIDNVVIEFGGGGVSHQKCPSLCFLLDEKKLYETCIFPLCKRYFGTTTEMYIDYQYRKILDSIHKLGVAADVKEYVHRNLAYAIKQKYLMLLITAYAKKHSKNAVYDRIDYLLNQERRHANY